MKLTVQVGKSEGEEHIEEDSESQECCRSDPEPVLVSGNTGIPENLNTQLCHTISSLQFR